jgi:hypothetical protein
MDRSQDKWLVAAFMVPRSRPRLLPDTCSAEVTVPGKRARVPEGNRRLPVCPASDTSGNVRAHFCLQFVGF